MLLAGLLGPLELAGEVADPQELVPAPVGDLREVPTLQVVCNREHRTILVLAPAALDRGPQKDSADRDGGRDLDDQPGRSSVAEDQPRDSNHSPPTV